MSLLLMLLMLLLLVVDVDLALSQDAFWWIFCEEFDKNSSDCSRELKFRIANNYIHLFYRVAAKHKDLFFSRLYDVLSQVQ